MANIVIYNPLSQTVPNRVTSILRSVNTPDYLGNPYVLINPVIPSISQSIMVVEGGLIREMTQTEKDLITTAENQVSIDRENTRLSSIDDKMVETQTITLTKVEVAIDNISNLADAKVFLKRMCRYLAKHYSVGA